MTKRDLIGEGKIARVYKVESKAYKVFPDAYDTKWIKKEVHIQQLVHQNNTINIPSCRYIEETHEIEMDFISGVSLAQRMMKEKYKNGLDDLINLQLSIHSIYDIDLECSHDSIKSLIKSSGYDTDTIEKAILVLESVEKKSNLCHFDFHFLNVMYDGKKYYVIDWINAKIGNPVFDIARTYIILKQYMQRNAEKYLKTISQRGDYSISEIKRVVPLMAILRSKEADAGVFTEKLNDFVKELY